MECCFTVTGDTQTLNRCEDGAAASAPALAIKHDEHWGTMVTNATRVEADFTSHHGCSLFSCSFQRIITCPVDFYLNHPMDCQWHFPMEFHSDDRRQVDSMEQINALIARASKQRAVGVTDMNAVSSRSHSIFALKPFGYVLNLISAKLAPAIS